MKGGDKVKRRLSIKEVRLLEGDTQAEAATKLRLHLNTYRTYEVRPGQMKIKTLLRFCEVYGVNVNDLDIFKGGY